MENNSKAIYYAINNHQQYLYFVKNSIQSLRRYNRLIKVFLFIFDPLGDLDLTFFREHNVEVIFKDSVKKDYLTSLKWFSLKYLAEYNIGTLLFVDADTYFFSDPENLFSSCQEADFYARQEIGTIEDQPVVSIGNSKFAQNLNHDTFNFLIKSFKVNKTPVFNTGLLLFNNFLALKVSKFLDFYNYVLDCFLSSKIPFPSIAPHTIDEVTSAIMFGKINHFNYSILSNEVSPWFIEYKEKLVDNTGIVIHIWSCYYIDFMEEFGFIPPNTKDNLLKELNISENKRRI